MTSSPFLAAILGTLLVMVAAGPIPEPQPQPQPEDPAASEPQLRSLQDRERIVETLEDDISRTALLAAAARAVREQQAFENDILRDTVTALVRDREDPEKLRREVRALSELVAQDKQQVEVLSAVLRAPRQVEASAGASASIGGAGGSDSGSILSLLPTLLGGSSGGGGGGDGGSGGGGGSNILSLVTGVLGASSGGGGSDAGSTASGPKGIVSNLILDKIAPVSTAKPVPGSYDDLIGKGITGYDPVAVFSNNLGGAIRGKFNIFNSLFSLLTSVLGASSGGSGGGGGGISAAASLSKS